MGDIVKVSDGELFPADLMCLHCALDEHICYVKTTNLDGETNLKVKRCAHRLPAQPAPLAKSQRCNRRRHVREHVHTASLVRARNVCARRVQAGVG